MNESKIGDTVRLKSGGPLMTVASPARSSDNVEVAWFNSIQVRESFHFHKDTLIKVEQRGAGMAIDTIIRPPGGAVADTADAKIE